MLGRFQGAILVRGLLCSLLVKPSEGLLYNVIQVQSIIGSFFTLIAIDDTLVSNRLIMMALILERFLF